MRLPSTPPPVVIGNLADFAAWVIACMRRVYEAVSRTQEESFIVVCSDETTALTTGTAKVTFAFPWSWHVYKVKGSLTTAQTSGSIFTVDVNVAGSTILSTKLTLDNGETSSETAATSAVIIYTSGLDSLRIDADARVTVDIDQVGDGTAKGLKLTFYGVRI